MCYTKGEKERKIMNYSLLADVESAFESFFASLTSSTSFNLLFFIGLGLELFFIALFVVKSRFSYEARMRRSLDGLNRWLFKYKTLDKENIKEFNDMVKKAPKRLAINWQQYILYREKAPSEYMSVENIIEKPLRTSSYALNIKNLVWCSVVWMLVTFVLGISYNNISDTVLNATMVIVALIVPLFIILMCAIAVAILQARKNANLDELYQNLHLFDRFIDNACVELPPYIDYSLLFTAEEIDKGIPALREYLESRARKEKEEFDKIAEEEGVVYEKYDFSKLGINGQNILERAMKESEAYLSKRDKTLAKIAQIEATLESLKRNFENVQKDYQKKMQITKENIERLRQQQEETTNRIESNFLRKQQNQELTKQEKDEADFEQQKRRYLVEKNDYEEVIKNLNEELEAGKGVVEEAMMSEFETFYGQLFNAAHTNAEKKVKDKIEQLKESNATIEEDLTIKEAQLKRVIDENETLKRKLGVEYEPIEIESAQKEEQKKQEEIKENSEEIKLQSPEEISNLIKEHKKEVHEELAQLAKRPEPKIAFPDDEDFDFADSNLEEQNPNDSEMKVEEYVPSDDLTETNDGIISSENAPQTKRRGRPKKGQEKTLEEIVTEKRPRGRPKKPTSQTSKVPGKRGRPAGSTKKKVEKPAVSRGRGRPKKETTSSNLKTINKKIADAQNELSAKKDELDNEIKKVFESLEEKSNNQTRRDEILAEINELKANVDKAKQDLKLSQDLEKFNKRIEELLEEVKSLND